MDEEFSEPVDFIVITGGLANISGLDDVIQSELNSKTLLADIFSSVAIKEDLNLGDFHEEKQSFTLPCGLALRNIA